MIVREAVFKDVFAFELITRQSTALVVPSQGGKLASFRDRDSGKEYLLQNPSETFLKTGLSDSFVDGECCGFDDMFPTIDPVSVTDQNGKTLHYPDHGEVCRVPFDYEATASSLTLRYVSAYMDYEYVKTFTESEDGALHIAYRITNRSDGDLDVLWAAHCLIYAEQGGQVLLPFADGETVDVMFDLTGRFKAGERLAYTSELLRSEWQEGVPSCKKLYFPRKAPQGFVAYRYPAGDVFTMAFDREMLPCIGVWENLGSLHGVYCLGLEPASVGYDTVKNAEAYGQKRPIKQGDTMAFSITLSVQK